MLCIVLCRDPMESAQTAWFEESLRPSMRKTSGADGAYARVSVASRHCWSNPVRYPP